MYRKKTFVRFYNIKNTNVFDALVRVKIIIIIVVIIIIIVFRMKTLKYVLARQVSWPFGTRLLADSRASGYPPDARPCGP